MSTIQDLHAKFEVTLLLSAPSLELGYCDNLDIKIGIRRRCKICGHEKDFPFRFEFFPHSILDNIAFEILHDKNIGDHTPEFRADCQVCLQPKVSVGPESETAD
jgi:hypothetical protein